MLLCVIPEEPPSPEKNLESNGRSVGRHATIRATAVSTTEKQETGALSKVGSVDLTMTRSEWRRTIDMMQTLHSQSARASRYREQVKDRALTLRQTRKLP